MPSQRKANSFLLIPIVIFFIVVLVNYVIRYYIQVSPDAVSEEFVASAEVVMSILSMIALLFAIIGAVMVSKNFVKTIKNRKGK